MAPLPRRPPFGDNPRVGVGGGRTQQRILRAALEVFGEVGYHDCGIDRITAQADCSRPSFYQYFSSKEDLFRALSGELAQRLFELSGRPQRIGADVAGWNVLRRFVADCGEVFDEYSPVFAVFSTAEAVDGAVATGSARVGRRQSANLVARLDRKGLRTRRPELVVSVMLDGVWRAQRFRWSLAPVVAAPLPRARLDDALDRCDPPGAVRPTPRGQRPRAPLADRVDPRSPDGRGMEHHGHRAGDHRGCPPDPRPAARRRASGRRRPRLPRSPGRRHRRVGRGVARHLLSLLREQGCPVPDPRRPIRSGGDRSRRSPPGDHRCRRGRADREIRRWLLAYFESYAVERPILRAWVEANWTDAALQRLSPVELEALRRRLARFLAPRRFGDIDADAHVLMALLDRSGTFPTPDEPTERAVIDAFTEVVQHGLLIVP